MFDSETMLLKRFNVTTPAIQACINVPISIAEWAIREQSTKAPPGSIWAWGNLDAAVSQQKLATPGAQV